jgi:dihydroxy-acid dehydratase
MRRTGKMTDEEFFEIESCMARSAGHCMVMGTASTMTCLAEGMGLTLTGSAAIPAVDTRRYAGAQESGKRIVEMVKRIFVSEILLQKSIGKCHHAKHGHWWFNQCCYTSYCHSRRLGIELN